MTRTSIVTSRFPCSFAEPTSPSGWRLPSFAATGWKTGTAPLGFGNDRLATVVGTTDTDAAKRGIQRPATLYFRHSITVANARQLLSVDLSMLRDDGVVVFVNDVEGAPWLAGWLCLLACLLACIFCPDCPTEFAP